MMSTPPPMCEFEAPPTPSTDRVKHGRTLRTRFASPPLAPCDEEPISPPTLKTTPTKTQQAKKTDSALLSAADTTETLGLPTPAKTPSKKRKLPDASVFDAPGEAETETPRTARLLFGEEIKRRASARKPVVEKKETPKKVHRKVHRDDEFEIFTDPTLRVPEVNRAERNPFLESDDEDSPATIKKQRKARRAAAKRFEAVGGNREDGMVYSFRGKKFFKKFDEDNPVRTITPRLLFPSARQEQERALREAGLDIVTDESDAGSEDELLTPVRPTLRAHSRKSSGASSVLDSAKVTKAMPTGRKLRSTPGPVDEVPRMWTPKRGRKIHFEVTEEEVEQVETQIVEVEDAEKVLVKKSHERKTRRTTTSKKPTATEKEKEEEHHDKAEKEKEPTPLREETTPVPETPKDQIFTAPETPPRINLGYVAPETPKRKTRLSHKRGLSVSPGVLEVEAGPVRKRGRRV
ncbi:hypothetical protein BJ508DRAFT_8658 [Ascobolus immersus RN42]|uniref:Uncharacterized protein n=1 Tax=Ascobolus immersus RN42 TaxID=1160509 RepID=A0A3N4HRH3_ASCIM|nr:hypothetical protein BJ508DRAFT_8658 [Ascobolus immersus RN42]